MTEQRQNNTTESRTFSQVLNTLTTLKPIQSVVDRPCPGTSSLVFTPEPHAGIPVILLLCVGPRVESPPS